VFDRQDRNSDYRLYRTLLLLWTYGTEAEVGY